MSGIRTARVETTQRLSEGLSAAYLWNRSSGAPRSTEARRYFARGMTEANAGHIRAGIEHLHHAIALDPRGEYRAHLAKLYTFIRQDEDAAATLDEAEQAPPADALSRDTMGCVYARLGNHAAALAHFAEAVRLDPRNVDCR
jgi:tetratricopeptide (TPR) repeat protein